MTQEPEQEPHPFHGPDEPTQEELEAWLAHIDTVDLDPDKVVVRGNFALIEFEYNGKLYLALRPMDMNTGKLGKPIINTAEHWRSITESFALPNDPNTGGSTPPRQTPPDIE